MISIFTTLGIASAPKWAGGPFISASGAQIHCNNSGPRAHYS